MVLQHSATLTVQVGGLCQTNGWHVFAWCKLADKPFVSVHLCRCQVMMEAT